MKNIRNDPQEYPEWPGTHLGGILFLTEPSPEKQRKQLQVHLEQIGAHLVMCGSSVGK